MSVFDDIILNDTNLKDNTSPYSDENSFQLRNGQSPMIPHKSIKSTSQNGGQTHITCCAQQCCVDMLRSFGRDLRVLLAQV